IGFFFLSESTLYTLLDMKLVYFDSKCLKTVVSSCRLQTLKFELTQGCVGVGVGVCVCVVLCCVVLCCVVLCCVVVCCVVLCCVVLCCAVLCCAVLCCV